MASLSGVIFFFIHVVEAEAGREVWGVRFSAGQRDAGRGKVPSRERVCWPRDGEEHPHPENSEVDMVNGAFIFTNWCDCHMGSYSLEFGLLVSRITLSI